MSSASILSQKQSLSGVLYRIGVAICRDESSSGRGNVAISSQDSISACSPLLGSLIASESFVVSTFGSSAAYAPRCEELGEPELPRNPGMNRNASKRALLKAIEEAGGN